MLTLHAETTKKVVDLLAADKCDYAQVGVILRGAPDVNGEKVELIESALSVTPPQYQKWLVDVLIHDEPFRALESDVVKHGFVASVLFSANLALAPSGKEARRGLSLSAREQLSSLRNSPYAKIESLLSECILKEEMYLQFFRGEGIDDETREICCKKERDLAIQHLPELVNDRNLVVELLKPVLSEPLGFARNWAAVHLSLLTPHDPVVASALIDSFFSRWQSSNSMWWSFSSYSGQVQSVLAFLSMASRVVQGGVPDRMIEEFSSISRCEEPAQKAAVEAAVTRLYEQLGSATPQIAWRDDLRPFREWEDHDFDKFTGRADNTTMKADTSKDGPVSIVVTVEHDASFAASLRQLCDALYIALGWHARGTMDSESESGEPDHLWKWPPKWFSETTIVPFDQRWRKLLQQTIVSTEIILGRVHARPILTQLDFQWIAFLDFLAKALGIEDGKLAALADITRHAGGAAFAQADCLLFERPQSHLWNFTEAPPRPPIFPIAYSWGSDSQPQNIDPFTKVSQLSAEQLAKLAYSRGGYNPNIDSFACKALYVATEQSIPLDASKVLAHMVDHVANHPLAVALTEHLLEMAPDEATRDELLVPQRWRFVSNGPVEQIGATIILRIYLEEKYLPSAVWDTLMVVRDESLEEVIEKAIGPNGEMQSVVDAVRNMMGVQSGLLKHQKFGHSVPLAEFYFCDRFEKTAEYQKFLDSTLQAASERTVADLSGHELAAIAARLWWEEWESAGFVGKALYLATENELSDVAIRLLACFASSREMHHMTQSYLPALAEYLRSLAYNEVTFECIDHAENSGFHDFALELAEHTGALGAGAENPDEQGQAHHTPVESGLPSPELAFNTVRRMIGVRAGLLRHKTFGCVLDVCEYEHENMFERTPEYERFLQVNALDELKRGRVAFGEYAVGELSTLAESLSFTPAAIPVVFLATKDQMCDEAAVALARSFTHCGRDGLWLAVCDHLLATVKTNWAREQLSQFRLLQLWELKLAQQIGHTEYCDGRPHDDTDRCCTKDDPADYEIDETAIRASKEAAVGKHSPDQILRAVRNALGVWSGILRHINLSGEVPDEELLHTDRFEHTEKYAEFLDATMISVDYGTTSEKPQLVFQKVIDKKMLSGGWLRRVAAGHEQVAYESKQFANVGAKRRTGF